MPTDQTIIGVDVGLDGGIALLWSGVSLIDPMPTLGATKGREYDVSAIHYLLEHPSAPSNPHVFIERQQAMPPKMGGSIASFRKGEGMGLFVGICAALQIPYTLVRPQEWQKVMFAGMGKADTKTKSALRAQQLFPELDFRKSERSKKIHDGMTDAILIAEYGRRILNGATP